MTVQERAEKIYETERAAVYTYLLYFGLPAARAQELAQDAFLAMYRRMLKGGEIENPRAWLYRVAHNLAMRSHVREPKFDELSEMMEPADLQPDPERSLIEKSRKAALRQAVRGLSPQQKNCLYLRVQGLRYREIGEAIGISTSAVGEFLRRAAVRLKEVMNA
ncbi:RNA polymerase, sigma-24 subunit, ECF subfamily [Candidatus Sulfopaludibacter sp. SbA3]|nr:RNA polymerase, sigma-24 subunit, ECF subfamily [Candidatus Sulfopaludibacter sp. SbA3]